MSPARGFRDRARHAPWLVKRVESTVGVGLKNPGISGEMLLGMGAAAIGRVEVHRGRRIGATEGAVVPHRSTAARSWSSSWPIPARSYHRRGYAARRTREP